MAAADELYQVVGALVHPDKQLHDNVMRLGYPQTVMQ